MEKIVGLKELRENVNDYIRAIKKGGDSFIVLRRSKPVFKISLLNEDDEWETVINFTKIKKGGVSLKELLRRL